jgi:hypothetical protein
MDNKEVKNIRSVEDDSKKLIEELKTLPAVKLPSDFDRKLKDKIARGNLKKQKTAFSYSTYSKALVYGGSFIVVICLVIFSFTIFRNTNEPIIKGTSFDSVYYGEKKVVVIPPTDNTSEGSVEKPIDKIIRKKDKPVNSEDLKQYFGDEKTEKSSRSVQSLNSLAPSSGRKSMEMDRSINVDTLRKKDSLKRILEKKK